MSSFLLFAKPWWVNLLILVPISLFWFWRKIKLNIGGSQIVAALLFGIAFGFVEAAVVVYLRAAFGILGGYQPAQVVGAMPSSLIKIEVWREAATMVMLLSVAYLSARQFRERLAVFLLTFAAWDFFFYAGLWLTIRWPYALTTTDILFLIPVPWTSQVWFPLLVSLLTMAAVVSKGWGPRKS